MECFARGLRDSFSFLLFRDSEVSNKTATLDGTFFLVLRKKTKLYRKTGKETLEIYTATGADE